MLDDRPETATLERADGALLALGIDQLGQRVGTGNGGFVLAAVVTQVVQGHAVDITIQLAAMLDLAGFELLKRGHDCILQQVGRELGVAGHAGQLRLETGHVSKEHLLLRSFLAGGRLA